MTIAGTVFRNRLPYKGSFLSMAQVATTFTHNSTLTASPGKVPAILLALGRRVIGSVVLLFLGTSFRITRVILGTL